MPRWTLNNWELPPLLSCEEARKLFEQLVEERVPVGQRGQLEGHLLACDACFLAYSEFVGRVQALEAAIGVLGESTSGDARLSDRLRSARGSTLFRSVVGGLTIGDAWDLEALTSTDADPRLANVDVDFDPTQSRVTVWSARGTRPAPPPLVMLVNMAGGSCQFAGIPSRTGPTPTAAVDSISFAGVEPGEYLVLVIHPDQTTE